jgi:hypothetical protein
MACLVVTVCLSKAEGIELATNHATIVYDHEFLLRDFAANFAASKKSFFSRRRNQPLTLMDETRASVDALIEQVQTILEMFSTDLHISIALLPSANAVQAMYTSKYGKKVDYIAFYAPKDKTVYLSVRDVSLRVLGHEIAHAVVDHHFIVSPPIKVHELLAQYVEAQLIN